ncbi:MAG TPA: undecaprenyl-diphosphate phosphatase [Baekduia sp.]|uniref:undecaprenyl-diphosphate phosphatase n=1 Tax=Baekduia sp. TaxID=2600305 RepID=UPI002D76AC24|nr:undecaprenyl-diphosphate phosphatase [Baekduia sp.]HET6509566.1 undecaprenyl-diphosphate phosphatase [Baekduia sp.]
MDALQAIILGIVQGLTEFLPISSTAHLRLVPAFAGWHDPGTAFTAVVQLGTMAAVLLYFRQDLWNIARAWLRSLRDPRARGTLDARLGWYLIVGTIPISILGLALKDKIETDARQLVLIGIAMIVLGVILEIAERVGRKRREVASLTMRDGILIGCAQACALVPGVSRSGSTISAGLFLGLTREAAARYSFLLSVPAVVLSGLFELKDVGSGGGAGAVPTIIATIFAFIVGYASIAWLLKYLARHPVTIFVVYRIVLGVVVLTLVATGALNG